MNKGLWLIPVMSIALVACERYESKEVRTDKMHDSSYENPDTKNLRGENVRTYRYSDNPTTSRYSDNTYNTSRFYDSDNARNLRTDADNTRMNFRDRNFDTLTSGDQSNSPDDILITKQIRRIIIDNGNLSSNAKNVKIITINGYVTLRGAVNDNQEKLLVERTVQNIEGVKGIDNQLDVSR